jgi:hypothetical protein
MLTGSVSRALGVMRRRQLFAGLTMRTKRINGSTSLRSMARRSSPSAPIRACVRAMVGNSSAGRAGRVAAVRTASADCVARRVMPASAVSLRQRSSLGKLIESVIAPVRAFRTARLGRGLNYVDCSSNSCPRLETS